MPKFQTEFTSDLKATLALLGIKAAFTNGQFPGITHDPAKIDFILHKVKFEIDEDSSSSHSYFNGWIFGHNSKQEAERSLDRS
ncbi:hypothetical protein L596_030093 [Steinernema carpocapsae]|uniref:Serpin domain-containing protein n=1 Tax=Steinernema carpocapsae TaxID=34508 RepID=A0A4U5LRQ6_STECR|nr:hypothetical protein L596_030093 [Steinernema carpocapsae]